MPGKRKIERLHLRVSDERANLVVSVLKSQMKIVFFQFAIHETSEKISLFFR